MVNQPSNQYLSWLIELNLHQPTFENNKLFMFKVFCKWIMRFGSKGCWSSLCGGKFTWTFNLGKRKFTYDKWLYAAKWVSSWKFCPDRANCLLIMLLTLLIFKHNIICYCSVPVNYCIYSPYKLGMVNATMKLGYLS